MIETTRYADAREVEFSENATPSFSEKFGPGPAPR